MSQQSSPKSKPKIPRAPQPKRWARNLTRRIVITKGPHDWLLSLDDARMYLLKHFQGATLNKPLDRAIELLIRAADTGRLADRESATAQVELVLKARHWL